MSEGKEIKEIQTPDRPYHLDGTHFKPGDKLTEEGLKVLKKHKANFKTWEPPKKKKAKI